jgi:hypothetical protein
MAIFISMSRRSVPLSVSIMSVDFGAGLESEWFWPVIYQSGVEIEDSVVPDWDSVSSLTETSSI